MIKAIIFDIGNVVHHYEEQKLFDALADWAEVSVEALQGVLQGPQGLFIAWSKGQIRSEEEFYRKLLASLGKQEKALPDHSLVLAGHERWRQDKNVMRLIARLKRSRYIVAALSNTIEPHARWVRTRGIYRPFEVVVLSCEEGCRKPEPEIYVRTLDRLGVAAEDTVFIDDALANVQGAQRVGMQGIHFHSAVQCENDLRGLGVNI